MVQRHVSGYDIPYRCLLPQGVSNIIVAGRAISATHVAMSSMRVQATCYAMGQAAGVAATLAIDNGCELEDIDMSKLHAILQQQDVVFLK